MISRSLSDGEFNSVLQILLDIILKDSRLGIYFFNLIDALTTDDILKQAKHRIERKLHSLVLNKLHLLGKLIVDASKNKKQQEIYNILLLAEKSQNRFSYTTILSHMILEEIDDMSLILWISQVLKSNHGQDMLVKLDELFNKDFNLKKDMFVQKHWMVRYEFYRLATVKKWNNNIQQFYLLRNSNVSPHQLDIEDMKNYQNNRQSSLQLKASTYMPTDFYLHLLDQGVGFTAIKF